MGGSLRHIKTSRSNALGMALSGYSTNTEDYVMAPNDKVTLFYDAGFHSDMVSLGPGEFKWLGTEDRDEISSVKVPEGLKLEMWTGRHPDSPAGQPGENPGRKVTFTSDQGYIGDEWNDHIDTVRVTRIQTNNNGSSGNGNGGSGNDNNSSGNQTQNGSGSGQQQGGGSGTIATGFPIPKVLGAILLAGGVAYGISKFKN